LQSALKKLGETGSPLEKEMEKGGGQFRETCSGTGGELVGNSLERGGKRSRNREASKKGEKEDRANCITHVS